MVSWTAGDDVPFVGLDLAAAGKLAAKHLLSIGYHSAYGVDESRKPECRYGWPSCKS
jgi:DNA-binding LacI/PurR family transcriptional regulator